MFKKAIQNFVVNYIKKSMSHADTERRDAVYAAISDGMSEEFTEDNVYTRVYTTLEWLLQNDKEYKKLKYRYLNECVDIMARGVQQTVLHNFYDADDIPTQFQPRTAEQKRNTDVPDIKEYKGTRCVSCNSQDIAASSADYESIKTCVVRMHCCACGQGWKEHFKIDYIEKTD